MKALLATIMAVTACLAAAQPSGAPAEIGRLDEIFNYKPYSADFASAGQPSEAQLRAVAEAGFGRVIYLAFTDQERSLPAEDRIVKELGMEYVQIAVDWQAPRAQEFEMYAALMTDKTFLHCQANFRASAFAMLYRVIHGGVPLAQAKADMNAVWTPNVTWTNFIRERLEAHDIDPDCESCDWEPSNF